jgi:hypothetical protein
MHFAQEDAAMKLIAIALPALFFLARLADAGGEGCLLNQARTVLFE